MWLLGSKEGERKRSDFILNWGSWEIFYPPFPSLGRKGEHSRGTEREREREGWSNSQIAGPREGRGGQLRGWDPRERFAVSLQMRAPAMLASWRGAYKPRGPLCRVSGAGGLLFHFWSRTWFLTNICRPPSTEHGGFVSERGPCPANVLIRPGPF